MWSSRRWRLNRSHVLRVVAFGLLLFRTHMCDIIGKARVLLRLEHGFKLNALVPIQESDPDAAPLQQKEPSVTLRQSHIVYITIPAKNTSACRLLSLGISEARNIQYSYSREGNIV